MPTLKEDAETVVRITPKDRAAYRLARAYLRAFQVRTVSENCQRLAIVDADHYESLIARAAESR